MANTNTQNGHGHHVFSWGGALVALGIIFGDIGTSPLYVFKAILDKQVVSEDLIYGGLSCVIWTLTLITTFKYVYLALNADNNGEGGIFALFALVRKLKRKWVIFPAIIGSASLLADGFITPPISIASAIEGLEFIPFLKGKPVEKALHEVTTIATNGKIHDYELVLGKPNGLFATIIEGGIHEFILPIIIIILLALFFVQQFGTNKLGGAFGPIMFVWFSVIAALGIPHIIAHPEIFKALSPHYGINLLVNHPGGFFLLGAVFLCTTGAEALYSDLGHCGKENIRLSWIFVKICLIFNYLGQGAWLLTQTGKELTIPPFYGMVPQNLLPYVVIIATFATIIASQALITGTFTLANEAMKLKLWPNMKVSYPTQLRGQIYIPGMNWILLSGCLFVILYFKESGNMEAAYGLAITINMIMTTLLLTLHLKAKHKRDVSILKNIYTVNTILIVFLMIEITFFSANILKFFHGGWFTCAIAVIIFAIMYVLYRARLLREKYYDFDPIDAEFKGILTDISKDYTVPKEATNLVYLCVSKNPAQIDKNIKYSIMRRRPKRADVYWFLHVDIDDAPNTKEYSVDELIPKKCFFIRIKFGFKVQNKVNLMFRYIVDRLAEEEKIDVFSHYPSLKKHDIKADFKFILLNSRVSVDDEISPFNQFIIRAYRVIKKYSQSPVELFGLETTNVEVENVPIETGVRKTIPLNYVHSSEMHHSSAADGHQQISEKLMDIPEVPED